MTTRRAFIRNTAATAAAIPLVGILTRRAPSRGVHGQAWAFADGRTSDASPSIGSGQETLADTGGRLDVRVFPNSQYGSEPDMLSQVRNGALDMVATSILYIEPLNPAINLSGLGYAFSGYDKVWAAWDGDYGKLMRANFEKAGIIVTEKTFDNGFRQVTTNVKPIQTAADLQGLKIRLPNIPIYQSLFQHLGAAPTTVNIKEVYSALRTRLADAQENPLGHIELFRFLRFRNIARSPTISGTGSGSWRTSRAWMLCRRIFVRS